MTSGNILIARCRMVNLIVGSTILFLNACLVTASGQRGTEPGDSSRFQPGSRTNSFDCETASGRYSELNSAISGTNVWVTGFMQVSTLNTASEWPPDAGIVFAGASKLPRVGLETFVLPDKPAVLQIAVRGSGGAGDHTVFASVPISDSKISFSLRLSSSGQLALSVGDAATSLSVGSIEITRMNLYCSSGHVHFSDVHMGSD
jgi:hypothetical protein